MNRIEKILILISIIIPVSGIGLSLYFYQQLHCRRVMNKPTKFIVEHSDDYPTVYQKLVQQKLCPNVITAKIGMKILAYKNKTIIPGEYRIENNYTLLEILNKLCSGDVIIHNIIIWRGDSAHSIKQLFNSRNDLLGALTIDIKEGELLAGKYEFKYPMSKNKMVQLIKEKSQKIIADLWEKRSSNCIATTSQECLSLASIVAKEALRNSDIPLVASVFTNRISKSIKLQSDPTVIYILTNGTFKGKSKLTYKDISIDNPCNTYRYKGIPPLPIASPAIADINAILHPIKTDYMYFISRIGDLKLYFSTTYNEHLNLKKKFEKEAQTSNSPNNRPI